MKKIRPVSVVLGTMLGGVVLACSMMAMPPLIVNVSLSDIASATAQGFSNPSRAAALINLDNLASAVLGGSTWHSNNFTGPVTYRVSGPFGITGVNIVTEDKPCDSDAIDKETVQSGGGGGLTDGSGFDGGGIFTPIISPNPTIGGGTNTGVVTIGEIEAAP